MYRFSKRSQGILEQLHPKLRKILGEAIKTSPHDFGLHEGYRSVEEQNRLFQQGRTEPGMVITWIDGKTQKGYHNYRPSLAFDFHCSVPGKTWDVAHLTEIARHILQVGKEMGETLEWGGDWKSRDYPHIQLPIEYKHYAEKEKLY